MNIKAGDWCFYEFKLAFVKEVNGPHSTIGTGSLETHGRLSDYCFPLDYRILQISQSFESYEDRLRKDKERTNLNWPDIHQWFVGRWVKACDADEKELSVIFDEVGAFVRDITDQIRDLRFKEVGGIRPFVRQ